MYIEHLACIDIPDAWFQAINSLITHGFKYEIQQGSFVGNTRIELDFITIYIKKPYSEPYDSMTPKIPSFLNIPDPVAPGYLEQYIPYLMTAEKQEDEDYTYGERLCGVYSEIPSPNGYSIIKIDQIQHFIDLLKKTPNTNQAVLQVAQPSDCLLEDPPCLREIGMRIKDNQLIFYPSFRSNDAWSGFPCNLPAIAILQRYMSDEIGVESGPMIYSSKGLHLYQYVEELARLRCNK